MIEAMTKRQVLDDPNSCLNRASDDEPIFVLRGRDALTPDTIRYWADLLRENVGDETDKSRRADLEADAIQLWQDETGNRKIPD